MEERNCFVYEDIRMDNWTCCYVGMGSKNEEKGYNRFEVAERNDHHDSIMDSCGIVRTIIRDNLTRSEANALEEARIYYYVFVLGYTIDIKGYIKGGKNDSHLTNQTWGGDGTKGYNPYADKTEEEIVEWKKKQSEAQKGEKAYWYGKNPYANKTEEEIVEWKKKQSEAKKGVYIGEKNPNYGKKRSEESKKKQSEAKSIPVIGVSIENEEVLELNSAKQGKEFGFNSGNITQCCKGKRKSHKGYKWYYKEDYEKLQQEIIETNLNLSLISNISISL